MLHKIESYCLQHELFHKGDTLVVACSGGPDSLALLDVLARLAQVYSLELVGCYVHHGIRKAADAEVDFVRHECEIRHCRFVWHHVDVPAVAAQRHESEETTGRVERYRILRETAHTYQAAAIAVAHQQDDQAETVLHHLLRGTGIAGLTGMRPKAGMIIRPLLAVTRREIEAYNRQQGLHPCEDETNQLLTYTRNRIRLELLPAMEKFNPAIRENLNRLALIAQADEDFLEQEAQQRFTDLVRHEGTVWSVSKQQLLAQPLAMQRRIIRRLLLSVGKDTMPAPYHYIDQIAALAHSPTGRRFDTGEWCVYTTYDTICCTTARDDIPDRIPGQDERTVAVTGDGTYQMGTYTWTVCTTKQVPDVHTEAMYIIDKDKCPRNLELRFRRPGDTIHVGNPLMKKSIKKYFIDKKIPVSLRHTIPLLCSGSEVLWICGYAGNTRYMAAADTKLYWIFTIQGGKHHA